jgi:hypothetical protein
VTVTGEGFLLKTARRASYNWLIHYWLYRALSPQERLLKYARGEHALCTRRDVSLLLGHKDERLAKCAKGELTYCSQEKTAHKGPTLSKHTKSARIVSTLCAQEEMSAYYLVTRMSA